jgi:hypothetical protein
MKPEILHIRITENQKLFLENNPDGKTDAFEKMFNFIMENFDLYEDFVNREENNLNREK